MPQKLGNILRRVRPRFTLRALLLAVTLLCVCIAAEVERWRREDDAMRQLDGKRHVVSEIRRFGFAMENGAGHTQLPLFGTVSRITIVPDWNDAGERDYKMPDAQVLTDLRGLRQITFHLPFYATDFARMASLQRQHTDIDVNCSFHCAFERYVSGNSEDDEPKRDLDRIRVGLGYRPIFEEVKTSR